MRITTKGQVTIPIEIRKKMGLLPETEVEFKITYSNKSYKLTDKIGIKLSKDLAKAKNKTIFGDTPAPPTFEAGRKVKDKAK